MPSHFRADLTGGMEAATLDTRGDSTPHESEGDVKKDRIAVTDSGTGYDRKDGLKVRLTEGQIRAVLRACVTALDAEPRGPRPPLNESEEATDFEVAACKLADVIGLRNWTAGDSWMESWDSHTEGDDDAAETLARDRDVG